MDEELSVFIRLRYIYLHGFKKIITFFAKPALEKGITLDEFYVLHDIATYKGTIRLMDIAKFHNVTRSAVARLIGQLLKKDYIFQETDSKDRRHKILKLTTKGVQIEHDIFKLIIKRNQQLKNKFSLDKQDELLDLTQEFIDAFINRKDEHDYQ